MGSCIRGHYGLQACIRRGSFLGGHHKAGWISTIRSSNLALPNLATCLSLFDRDHQADCTVHWTSVPTDFRLTLRPCRLSPCPRLRSGCPTCRRWSSTCVTLRSRCATCSSWWRWRVTLRRRSWLRRRSVWWVTWFWAPWCLSSPSVCWRTSCSWGVKRPPPASLLCCPWPPPLTPRLRPAHHTPHRRSAEPDAELRPADHDGVQPARPNPEPRSDKRKGMAHPPSRAHPWRSAAPGSRLSRPRFPPPRGLRTHRAPDDPGRPRPGTTAGGTDNPPSPRGPWATGRGVDDVSPRDHGGRGLHRPRRHRPRGNRRRVRARGCRERPTGVRSRARASCLFTLTHPQISSGISAAAVARAAHAGVQGSVHRERELRWRSPAHHLHPWHGHWLRFSPGFTGATSSAGDWIDLAAERGCAPAEHHRGVALSRCRLGEDGGARFTGSEHADNPGRLWWGWSPGQRTTAGAPCHRDRPGDGFIASMAVSGCRKMEGGGGKREGHGRYTLFAFTHRCLIPFDSSRLITDNRFFMCRAVPLAFSQWQLAFLPFLLFLFLPCLLLLSLLSLLFPGYS